MMKGGQGGPAVVPGDPEKSRLIEAIRYNHSSLRMPPKGRLPENSINDLTKWVQMGAPSPEDPKSPANPTATNSLMEQRRRTHWAWQPLKKVTVPVVKRKGWTKDPIDAFILAKLEAKGLTTGAYADRRTLIRRA